MTGRRLLRRPHPYERKPADLPVQLSVKYETVLNKTTARALGLDVPTSILLSADEPIEEEYRNARRLDRRRQQWVKSVVWGARADVRYYPQSDRDSDVPSGRKTLPLLARAELS